MMRIFRLPTVLVPAIALATIALAAVAYAENIDPDNDDLQYAWGENAGWINFEPSQGPGVTVRTDRVTGYAWGENIGWISMHCDNTAYCATVSYGVTNDGAGNLSGYAWSENKGWISFSCANTASCGAVNYGVTLDMDSGDLAGYAYGENIGWISFNCGNTGVCGTAPYAVIVDVFDNDGPIGTFGGTQAWIRDGVGPEGATGGSNSADINDDNDLRCTDGEETGGNLALGGMRNPLNPWDFADVPTPALPQAGAVRNGAVSLTDVSAALIWVGTTNGGGLNANGRDYDNDANANAVEDGAEYDRTPGGEISGPPNGAVNLSDVGVVLAQVGDNCNAAPN